MAKIVSLTNNTNTISAGNYNLVQAFVSSRISDPIIMDQLVQAYTEIAASLNISVQEFIQLVQSQGSNRDQDLYLATLLNTVRASNALIGVGGTNTPPVFIAREISA